jgi:hypothetical protein
MIRPNPLLLAITATALASFVVLVAHAQTPAGAHAGAATRVGQGAAAMQRGVVTDGQGNLKAGSASGFTTASGGQGARTTQFTRSADGTASGERNATATNASTGVTFDGTATYTKGSGVSRSASCTDAAGNTVTCGKR